MTEPICSPAKQVQDGRWEMDVQQGRVTYHLEWGQKPTPDDYQWVVDHVHMISVDPGEEIHAHKFSFGPFRVFVYKCVGPPPWWIPRLYPVFKGGIGVRFGWRFTAYEWTVRRKPPLAVSE